MRRAGVLAAMAVLAPSGLAAGRGSPFVSRPAVLEPTEGTATILHGHVLGAPRGSSVALQARGPARWRTLARARVRGRSFTLTWRPRASLELIRFAPGSYPVQTGGTGGFCRGHAVVAAGQIVKADGICPTP